MHSIAPIFLQSFARVSLALAGLPGSLHFGLSAYLSFVSW